MAAAAGGARARVWGVGQAAPGGPHASRPKTGWATREGKEEGEAGRGWAKRREGEIFRFLFSSYFPIIQFIPNFLLNVVIHKLS